MGEEEHDVAEDRDDDGDHERRLGDVDEQQRSDDGADDPGDREDGRSRVSCQLRRSLAPRMPLMSRFGKAITTTAVSMSTNSAAIGMTMTGNPIPVTDLAIDPMTTAANTIASSVPFTPSSLPGTTRHPAARHSTFATRNCVTEQVASIFLADKA